MDGYNNQRNVFYSRPQMPQPPCMNTNCRFSYNTLPPMDPMFDNQMVSAQMMADQVSMSSCGRGEVAGRSEMSMWEPRRGAREEARGEVRGEVKSEMRCAPRHEARCEPRREPRSEVRSGVRNETEIAPVCETRCETKCETKCEKRIEMGSEVSPAMLMGCDDMPIGMAYVPWQKWGPTYPIDQALNRATIFPELDLPFEMGRCR